MSDTKASPAKRRTAAALALAGLVALTGCQTETRQDDGPQVDVLGSMLASESELNTMLGTDSLRPKTALRVPAKVDGDEQASRPECVVVIGNAMDWLYRDSDYHQFRETLFTDDTGDLEVDQAVTTFDNPAAARSVVTRTVAVWRQCANDTLTISEAGNDTPDVFLLAAPDVLDGVDVTHNDSPVYPGYGSRRAILAVDNMVVDVRITGQDISDGTAVQLAKTIAGRNAL
ncbi:sensor domain-containing protein [Mycobacterium sp. 21AC1]|uniref:sensor domain-containing protein n=1 Tax=[Mycobacterium] appelbergii TaxID=2939269 RepID=UPI002938DDDC|nr:sensor domain-containing protein [Mycobacterium sp. 21AC1]MDV3125309.1 sensor domain-containing protein [Mycobacterium sp. 21AC1]